jgi:thioredoxin domain-containing protein 10
MENCINLGIVILFLLCVVQQYTCQVAELDDSFTDKKGDRAFLVKFYAPWCGHCRKLEPTYHQVYLELKNSKITVAKVDATRFTRLASEFDVHGYPTIKFIQGDRVYTHNGERSKEGIVEFAKRAFGPQVRPLTSVGRLSEAKAEHMTTAFFLYVGSASADEQLYTAYKTLAEKYAVLSYFYAGDRNVVPSDVNLSNYPTVAVFKDGTYSEFTAPSEANSVQEVLDSWVNKERFVAFPKISGVGLNEMSSIGKLLAIFVIDDKDQMNNKQTSGHKYRDIGQQLATDSLYAAYRSQYQLVWMTDIEVASNIIMSSIESPFMFVLDPRTHQHFIPDWSLPQDDITVNDVTDFLDSITNGSQQAYGGTGLGQRFKRLFYDIWTTVYGIYRESIWLALMVFGIPTLVIGIICYTLCCLEPAEEDELNTGSDDDGEGSELLDDETAPELHDRPDSELITDHTKSE